MFRAFPVNPHVRITKLVAALKTIQETAERAAPASVEATTLNLIAAIAREARAAELEHVING